MTRVLVAGAGPTGLTLAIELARRDIAVRVVDKADTHFAGSRGDGIQPRTLEVFEDLGVLDAVLAAGIPGATMRVHIGGEFVTERRMSEPVEPTPDIPYPNPWILGQSDTEAVLRARLSEFGVRVELGTALTGAVQHATGVTATLTRADGTETVTADHLVAADGGRSTVRKLLGIPFEGSTDDSIRMLLGDVRADSLDHEYGHWFAASAERAMEGFALSPLPGGRHFQFGAPLQADVEPTLETLQGMADRYAGKSGITFTDLAWVTVWRPNIRLARRFRDGRIFLAGDAAHVHPPTGGQGMNTGIQDAYNLGWKLAAALDGTAPDAETLLDTYESERRTVAARVLGLSTELLDKMIDGDEDAMERGPQTRQLDISYRAPGTEGPLVAGDRAPDAPLKDADGQPVRLFELFRGPHATTLVFGGKGDLPTAPGTRAYRVIRPGTTASGPYVVDVDGHAHRAYAAQDGTVVRIRPDGHVGGRD